MDETLKGRLSVTVIAAKPGAAVPPEPAEGLAGADLSASRIAGRPHVVPVPGDRPSASSLSAEQREHLVTRHGGGRTRKTGPKLRQSQLPLAIISKGRFDKSEPTIHKGEDLDIPTYIRRGVSLN